MNKFSNLIILIILIVFIDTIVKSQSIYSSVTQNNNIVDIHLTKQLYQLNITSLDYLLEYQLNNKSVLNSCIFKTDYFTLDLTNLKNKSYSTYKDNLSNHFSICSDNSIDCGSEGLQSCLVGYSTLLPTGLTLSESFQIGRYGIDDFALLLTYTHPNNNNEYECGLHTRNYYFHCNETQEISYTSRDYGSYTGCTLDVDINTKYVCPYKNLKTSQPANYSLVQPNVLLVTLDKSSTNVFSFNNRSEIQTLHIRPIIYNCTNEGDIITVNGLFFDNLMSHYTFNFEGGYSIPTSSIISFNSTTLILNSAEVTDNYFYISLDGIESYVYPIIKPKQQHMVLLGDYIGYSSLVNFRCTNCIGAKLNGFKEEIIIGSNKLVSIDLNKYNLNYEGIYLVSPISPLKRSNVYSLPTDLEYVTTIGNQVFQFNGSSDITITGDFIPANYNNQPYIIGKLQFINGTIHNLEYTNINDKVHSTGIFKVPPGYGNGTFSIYIIDSTRLFHSNSFSYQPSNSSNWVKSINQNVDKVELQLSFPHYYFSITSIKYDNKVGIQLDYKLVEPNIITFKLHSESSTLLSFNNDYHIETIFNGQDYRPVVYNYSVVGNLMTMDGLYLSKSMTNYKFYDGKNLINANDQLKYFTNSRIILITLTVGPNVDLYVYSAVNTFTKVPDISITNDENNILFTCSNCFGGYINGVGNSQDTNFTEIGTTIVKQFDRNTIGLENAYTFIKDSRTIVLQPPLPTQVIIDKSVFQFSTFKNEIISIKGNFLYDKYNGEYTSFEFKFNNGTIYSVSNQIPLSNSSQNYKYQFNSPFAFGSGNFTTFINLVNGTKSIVDLIPFKYPSKPIIKSVSNVTIGGAITTITINGDGFFGNALVSATFKKIGSDIPDIKQCSPVLVYDNGSTIVCGLNINNHLIYSVNAPITFQITTSQTPEYQNNYAILEPAYFQSYFDSSTYSPSPSPTPPSPSSSSSIDIVNNDISLHSIISTLMITLSIAITILIQ